jgi:hypothetical protein
MSQIIVLFVLLYIYPDDRKRDGHMLVINHVMKHFIHVHLLISLHKFKDPQVKIVAGCNIGRRTATFVARISLSVWRMGRIVAL